jgi:tetratricopeptide (TPR) repeat protein
MVAVPEHGRLDETPLPRLLLDLHAARFGGALALSRERVGKRFLFHEGAPVFAESNLASESLGVQLMDAGRLERADYARMTAEVQQRGKKEGAVLLELGLIQPKDLFVALKDQVRSRLVECFGWTQGEWRVEPDAETPADARPFRADLYAVLQQGLETHWSRDRMLSDLAPRLELFPRRAKSFDAVAGRLRADPAVEAVLEAIDGTRSLWKVLQHAATPRALAACWVLEAAGAIDCREQPVGSLVSEVEIVVEETEAPRAAARPGAAAPAQAARRAGGASQADGLRREIEERFQRLADLDHYQILGLEPSTNPAAIKRAYLEAAKRYHPDALARLGLDEAVRAQANRVFAEIGKAHAVLSDPRRRREYDSVRSTQSSGIDANRLAQAETLFRKGDVLLRSGNFRGAVEFLRPCVELWPEECAYQSALGWALFKKQPPETEAARDHLQRAIRLDPDDGVTLFRLSVVLRELGDIEGAEAAAARASKSG